jgi:PhzF family phenazine biosynthesis protein
VSSNLWIVDAFTPVAFRGNAAAVYLLDEFGSDEKLQLLAMQANLSDTAFVVKNDGLDFDLRWFTPETEVKLCGHATLASAHVLVQAGQAKKGDVVKFSTLSGILKAKILDSGIELDFPTLAGSPAKPDPALNALGVSWVNCERSRDDFLVEVKDFDTLLAIKPDMKKLAKLKARGVIVTTSKGVSGYDFASRFFAPAIGINEDPVTGSAHCFLAPYWAKKLGKNKFRALQASRSRGVLEVRLDGERTYITGECVTTIKGQVNVANTKSKSVAKTAAENTKEIFV